MNRDGKCDKTWECDLMPSPYREWCWGELGCAGNGGGGTTPASIDCDALPGTAPAICKTYLALRDHPGWWTRGTWNGYRAGTLSPQAFLGLVLRMEFNGWGGSGFDKVDEYFHGCTGNPLSASDIFMYLDNNKGLIWDYRSNMILPEDADSTRIAAVWKDLPNTYSHANFEWGFLHPNSAWASGEGEKEYVAELGQYLYTKPFDWGSISMIRYGAHPERYQDAYDLINSSGGSIDKATGLAENRFFIVRGYGDSATIQTLSQRRYWRGS
jgi:hypothetical protein